MNYTIDIVINDTFKILKYFFYEDHRIPCSFFSLEKNIYIIISALNMKYVDKQHFCYREHIEKSVYTVRSCATLSNLISELCYSIQLELGAVLLYPT